MRIDIDSEALSEILAIHGITIPLDIAKTALIEFLEHQSAMDDMDKLNIQQHCVNCEKWKAENEKLKFKNMILTKEILSNYDNENARVFIKNDAVVVYTD